MIIVMDLSIDTNEFAFVNGLPRSEKKQVKGAWDRLRDWMAICDEHGPVVSVPVAAKLLNVSKQRAFQIMQEGRFKAVEFEGHRYVTCDSIIEFAGLERKSGRPVKIARVRDSIKLARELVAEK